MNATKTLTLREFWNNHNVTSIFVVGVGSAGETYRLNVGPSVSDEDYCDLGELLDTGLFPEDETGESTGWELEGEVQDDGDWEWNGSQPARDRRGNSYTRIVLEAEEPDDD